MLLHTVRAWPCAGPGPVGSGRGDRAAARPTRRAGALLALAFAALAAGAGCGPMAEQGCALPKTAPAVLQAMLQEGRFAELDETLRRYQDAAERDPGCEGLAWWTFWHAAGGPGRDGRRPELDAFAAALPESFVPYAVRGDWWLRLGLKRRGSRVIAKTTAAQREGMRDAFARALPDLLRALELRPTASLAHGGLIELLRTLGLEAELHATFDYAVRTVPGSHHVRERMIDARAPKWGGSRAEQAALAFDAWGRRGQNPHMWFAVGGLFVSLADDVWHEHHRLGTAFYDLALFCYDGVSWYERRAKARRWIGDADGALADVRAMLERDPWRESAWEMLAGTLQKRGDWAGAARELDRALEISPASIPLLEMRAYSHSKARNMDAAEADYRRLLELDRSSKHFQAYSRFLVEEKRRDYERAVTLMQEATRLDPLDAENWGHLGAAQYMTGDPENRRSYERFLALLDMSVAENVLRARWIRAHLAKKPPPPAPHRRGPARARASAPEAVTSAAPSDARETPDRAAGRP